MGSMFDNQSLHAVINKVLEDSGTKDNNAFVLAVTKGGIKGVITHKVGHSGIWTVEGYFGVDFKGQLEGQAQIKATWPSD